MKIFLYAVNIVSALLMVGVILLQQGKGAEMGSGFGRGSSGTLFGARGSANFLTRMTSVLATVFFLSAFMLTFLANKRAPDDIIRGIAEDPPAIEQPLLDGEDAPAEGEEAQQEGVTPEQIPE